MTEIRIKFRGMIFSLLFISALTSSLFYTGLEPWQFMLSSIFLTLLLATILQHRFHKSTSIQINGIFTSVILLLIWYVISVAVSQIKYLSVHNFFLLGSILFIFILFSFENNKNKIWNTTWPLVLFLILIWALWGLVQYYYLNVATNASFLNRNTLAALINLVLIPASGYFLLEQQQRPWKLINTKLLSIILFILFLTTFIITSRGGSLSLILGFTLLLYLLKNHIKKPRYLALFTIIIVAFLFSHLSQYYAANLPSGFTERMVSLTDSKAAGHPRFIIWESILPLFKEMPWYGFGLGSFWLFWAPHRPANDQSAGFFAHNDYMQMTIEAGYPGILLLLAIFIFVVLGLIRSIKKNASRKLSLLKRVELISLFSALTTYSAHSVFTYNFYVYPLLLIAGLYLARFSQIMTPAHYVIWNIPALKKHFIPVTFYISLTGIVIILSGYFIALVISNDYTAKANQLILKKQYQESNDYFLKAQRLAPLTDNPLFSHANLLMISANELKKTNKLEDAEVLYSLSHIKLNQAEALNPRRHQIFHIRGLLFMEKQPEKAILQYKKALSLAPRFLPSRIQLAFLLHKQGRLNQAIKILHQGLYYKYQASKDVITYLQLYANYAKENGNLDVSLHLENEIKKVFSLGSK